jgi:23S rRNA C2498 (ribose-2'-O)-methylase RlmM
LLRELGDSLIWRAKQLFHDREEVTCLITRREYLR